MEIFDGKLYHLLRYWLHLNDEVSDKNYPKEIAGMYLMQLGYSMEEVEDTCVQVNVILNMLGNELPKREIDTVIKEATSKEHLKKVVVSWFFTVLACSVKEPTENQIKLVKYMISSLNIDTEDLEKMIDEGDQRGYFFLRSSAAFYLEGFYEEFLNKHNS